jgi:hypothetical protein
LLHPMLLTSAPCLHAHACTHTFARTFAGANFPALPSRRSQRLQCPSLPCCVLLTTYSTAFQVH